MNLPILTFDEPTMTAITALTAALTRTADNQERLLAGQQAAIEKLDAGKPAPRTPRAKKDEAPAAAAETVVEQKPVETTTTFLPANVTDADTLRIYVTAWTGAAEGDEKVKRVDMLKAIAAHFGVEPKFAPLSADADRLKQTLFFIERSKAGHPVDFKADYDFAGDPAQGGGAVTAPADDSDFG